MTLDAVTRDDGPSCHVPDVGYRCPCSALSSRPFLERALAVACRLAGEVSPVPELAPDSAGDVGQADRQLTGGELRSEGDG